MLLVKPGYRFGVTLHVEVGTAVSFAKGLEEVLGPMLNNFQHMRL